MPIGITLAGTRGANAVDTYVDLAQAAEASGLATVWLAQLFDVDALALAAVIGRETTAVEIGTAVVPVHPLHPLIAARQALTAQAAAGGRVTLGLGLSNAALASGAYGVDWDRPILHLTEYLSAVGSVFDTGVADVRGATLTAVTPLPATVAGATSPPVLIGAAGPQALGVAGRLADGAIALHSSPAHLSSAIAPSLIAGAREAGRPTPRLVVAVAAVVTSEPARVHSAMRETMGFYSQIPSWARALRQQGLDHAADLALVGDEQRVSEGIAEYFAAGATDVAVIHSDVGGEADRRRTWELLGELETGSRIAHGSGGSSSSRPRVAGCE